MIKLTVMPATNRRRFLQKVGTISATAFFASLTKPAWSRNLETALSEAEEIAINRNSSEGLETVIFGLQLKAGDEIVAAKQDYPNMVNAYNQRQKRDGIKMVWINLELPSEDENYLADQYIKAFTPKTKLVHITHIIN